MKPIKLYIAGKYNDDSIIKSLDHIRNGQRAATEAIMKGFVPFCPWLDYQLFLQLREGEQITKDQIQAYSIEWLKVCDAILMLPSWKTSTGARAELEIALKIGLPVFWTLQEAVEYFETDEALLHMFQRHVEDVTGIKIKDIERIIDGNGGNGKPGQIQIEMAEQKMCIVFSKLGCTPEEYDLAISVGEAAVKAAREVTRVAVNGVQCEHGQHSDN